MNHIILVKHSLSEVIPATPASQWRLSQAGQTRCKTLAEKLMPYSPDVIVSSMEPKAIETAQFIARQMDKPSCIFESLHEHDRTGVEFLERAQFESKVQEFFRHPDELVTGRETAHQARDRFSNALTSITADYPGKSIAVVAHGTVITLFVEKRTGLEPYQFWKKLDLPSFVVFSLPGYKLVTIVESVV